ncbi:MAG TPA: helix-turn-helix transcriptional regulator [Thiobacillaceae bacterium]|nr:helix-turn-helix transcriptional regulator [Thiobacillaceae bacterium]
MPHNNSKGSREGDPILLDLVGDIYQAGLEPERWPSVLARLSWAFAADLACIYTPFPARPEQTLYLTHNFTPEMEQAYSAYYHRLDEWTGAALRQGRYIQGTVALGEEIVPQSELRRTEYYNDFLKVHDMEWMVTTALFDGRAEGPATHMSFTRRRSRDAYGQDGKDLIALLAPHVRRALLTHWRISQARLDQSLHQSALGLLGYGVILLAEDGRVVYLNDLAESLLRAGDGLSLRADRLHALDPRDDDAVDALIRHAGIGLGGGLCISRAAPAPDAVAPPYCLTATPLAEDLRHPALAPHLHGQRPKVMLLVHDPARARPVDGLRALVARHHITQAELHVLQLLLRDMAPKRIAETLEVSIRTVRSQLSSLFAKTGTRNQRELVALALRQGGSG